jgi:hypothetical protein
LVVNLLASIFIPAKSFAYLSAVSSTVEVHAGASSADITLSLFAYPFPEISWYHNGVPLDLSTKKYEMM